MPNLRFFAIMTVISLFATPFAFGKAPLIQLNYDESKVPPYTLPDPLVMSNGERVADAKMWRLRRDEILKLFETHVYGKSPGRPKNLRFKVKSVAKDAIGGKATRKQVTVFLTGRDDGPTMNLLLYIPNAKINPAPAFLGLNYFGNECVDLDPGIELSDRWMRPEPKMGIVKNRTTEKTRGCQAYRWQVEMVIDRGYALATAYYGDLEPDHPDGWKDGIRAALSKDGDKTVFKPDDWGAIGAWAWGLSRAMDYLETDPDINPKCVAVVGHSRLGKTALWAGAQDKRFAMVVSNNSGASGAALSKRIFGETVEKTNTVRPHWFCDNYNKYNRREELLPIDQHELIALIAPRPVYVASAEEDLGADPRGEFLGAKGADPVYRLLGKNGLNADDMPPVEKPLLNGSIGYHVRRGKHDQLEYDWRQFLDFANRRLRPFVNYDESKVPPYTLPDPLVMSNGERVADAKMWRVRRDELLKLFETHVYGKSPGRPKNPRFKVKSVANDAIGGKATRKQVTVFLTGRDDGPKMDLLLYIPNARKNPASAFLGLNYFGNECVDLDPGIELSDRWMRTDAKMGIVKNRTTEKTRGCQAYRWQVEMVIDRGYALATAYYGDLEPDHPDGWKTGIRAALSKDGDKTVFKPDDWGAIGAWAWGLSRAMDYLETDPDIDAKRVAVVGHSRLGKTALWTGAQDERFAMAISNDSGAGGAKLAKRIFGAGVEETLNEFPYWFCGNYKKYSRREELLPIDQHELIALIAPRPVYVASAEEDRWADPSGEFLSAKGADPVYRLLGTDGLKADDMPSVDNPSLDGTIGYHIRRGKHDQTEYDWRQFLDFADRRFK